MFSNSKLKKENIEIEDKNDLFFIHIIETNCILHHLIKKKKIIQDLDVNIHFRYAEVFKVNGARVWMGPKIPS